MSVSYDAAGGEATLRCSRASRIGAFMDVAPYEAAGLYDPKAANASERQELLEWLAARGITIEQMVHAQRETSLTGLAADLALRPGRRFTADEVAARAGVPVEQVLGLSLAAGLNVARDEAVYSEGDVQMFAGFAVGRTLFGETATRRFTHTIGSALGRVAEAAVTLYQVNVEGPIRAAGGTELEFAQQNLRAIEALQVVERIIHVLFRAHVESAIRRLRLARPRKSADTALLAVGFVDMVGFTTLSHRISTQELGEVVERFEETAHDVVTALDGRLVKVIGDEVMFVVRDPAAACDIALTLVERFKGDPAVTPRGGVAVGELLVRSGDYYGPIVNLASRVAQLAVPNEMLVTAEVAAAASGSRLRFEPAGKRMLKGLDEPVTLLAVERA